MKRIDIGLLLRVLLGIGDHDETTDWQSKWNSLIQSNRSFNLHTERGAIFWSGQS